MPLNPPTPNGPGWIQHGTLGDPRIAPEPRELTPKGEALAALRGHAFGSNDSLLVAVIDATWSIYETMLDGIKHEVACACHPMHAVQCHSLACESSGGWT
jgi:hypothetical protein